MLKFQKILVPLDLESEPLGHAAEAFAFAGEFGAEVLLLHVCTSMETITPQERQALSRLGQLLSGRSGRLLLVEGPPAKRIIQTASDERVDLIFMPARKESRKTRWFRTSVMAHVLRSAPCPVWTGTGSLWPADGPPIRRVLCAVSLGPGSGAVLRWASNLAASLDADLALVHAGGDEPATMRMKTMVELQNLQASAGKASKVYLETGRPSTTVPWIAGQLDSDLLVIGRGSLARLFPGLRGQSYDIIHQAPCPVASV